MDCRAKGVREETGVKSAERVSVLCDALLGNVFLDAGKSGVGGDGIGGIDWVSFEWAECRRRAQRKRSGGGVDCSILLGAGSVIRHGDVLYRFEDGRRLAAEVAACEVLVGKPGSWEAAARVAYGLGNLHWPVQVVGATGEGVGMGEIVTIADGPAEGVFRECGVVTRVEQRRFEPEGMGWGVELAGDFFVKRV